MQIQRDQKSYPLPSALADGQGSQNQRVIANVVKQSHIRTDCFVVPPRNDGEMSAIPDPLPKGNGKGYSPEMNDCTLQKHYSLPSALADGHENHQRSVTATPRNEGGSNLKINEIALYLATTGTWNLKL